MEQLLDLNFANDNDIYANIEETIDVSITCFYFIDTSLYFFDFTPYTGATLTVKDEYDLTLTIFSTDDNSMILKDGGVFEFIKHYSEMDDIEPGKYNYIMQLSSNESPNIDFLSGKIIF